MHVDSQITRVLENNQILKIALFDEQAKLAAELNAGDYIAIKNLRLRPARAGADGDLVGRLGGDERLIFKLQPKVSANEDLQELLEYVDLVVYHVSRSLIHIFQTEEGT